MLKGQQDERKKNQAARKRDLRHFAQNCENQRNDKKAPFATCAPWKPWSVFYNCVQELRKQLVGFRCLKQLLRRADKGRKSWFAQQPARIKESRCGEKMRRSKRVEGEETQSSGSRDGRAILATSQAREMRPMVVVNLREDKSQKHPCCRELENTS